MAARANRLVLLGRGPYHQAAGDRVEFNLRAGGHVAQHTGQLIPSVVLDRVDDDPALVLCALRIELLDRFLDLRMLALPGSGDDRLGPGILLQQGVGHEFLQDPQHQCHIGVGDRIDLQLQLGFRRIPRADRLHRILDDGLLFDTGPDQQAPSPGVDVQTNRIGKQALHQRQNLGGIGRPDRIRGHPLLLVWGRFVL